MRNLTLAAAVMCLVTGCGPADAPQPESDPAHADDPPESGQPAADAPAAEESPPRMSATADANARYALWGTWVLVAIDDEPLPEGLEPPSMTIDPDAVNGFAGVNRFQGTLDPEGATLFGPMISTRMAGPPAAMELEQRFLQRLDEATGYWVVENEELVIETDGEANLKFRRAADQ